MPPVRTAAEKPAPRATPAKTAYAAPQPAVQKPAFAAKPAPAVSAPAEIVSEEEDALDEAVMPAVSAAVTNRQIWDKMLKQFEKSPFVYDVMTNCSVTFGESEWTLCFPPGKEFYQIPAQNKLSELEEAAKKICGRVIKFKLAAAQEEKTPAPAPAARPAARKTAASPSAAAAISDEEPFVKASFEADVMPAASAVQDAPEELKDILEVIPENFWPNPMKSLDRLVRAFRRLPGVGPRQAERFAAYFLRASQGEAEEFVNALLSMKQDVKLCRSVLRTAKRVCAKSAGTRTATAGLSAWWKTRRI